MYFDQWNNVDVLTKRLIPQSQFVPDPPITDRKAWDSIAPDVRDIIIRRAEPYLGHQWESLRATDYYAFKRDGDRSAFEAVYFTRRSIVFLLVMAECVENKGRFLDDIINGLFLICEESTWVLPAHNHMGWHNSQYGFYDVEEFVIDLFAAETGSLLSMIHLILGPALDRYDPLVTKRIRYEVDRRILKPYLYRNDFPWMHSAYNWTTWCTANCLISALLMETDDILRVNMVKKALSTLDFFLAHYPEDGGCDEGPNYWTRAGGSLFDSLDYLYRATNGAIDLSGNQKIKNICRYIADAHITDNYYVNYADGPGKINGNFPFEVIFRFGKYCNDDVACSMAASQFQKMGEKKWNIVMNSQSSLHRHLSMLLIDKELSSYPAKVPAQREAFYPNIEVLYMEKDGLYLSAKGGSNAESHNHNDVGTFIVFKNKQPVIIDVGVETYSKKTFGPDRYTIWTMRSSYHNVPTINGCEQFSAPYARTKNALYEPGDSQTVFSFSLEDTYGKDANLDQYSRSFHFDKESPSITIEDYLKLKTPSSAFYYSFMTLAEPKALSETEFEINGARLAYEPTLQGSVEPIDITDPTLAASWGNRVYRILLEAKEPVLEQLFTFTLQ